MDIKVTGNSRIDQATAEIAVALRDAAPGNPDQDYYDAAQSLRDEIMAGTRALAAAELNEARQMRHAAKLDVVVTAARRMSERGIGLRTIGNAARYCMLSSGSYLVETAAEFDYRWDDVALAVTADADAHRLQVTRRQAERLRCQQHPDCRASKLQVTGHNHGWGSVEQARHS